MKEKLIIKNFGPIKSVELELGRFNVLIGEQATGKSTVAKLLAVCRYFSYVVDFNNYQGYAFEQGLIAWGLNEFIQNETVIHYESYHYSLVAKQGVRKEYDRDQETGEHFEIRMPAFELILEPRSNEFKVLLAELEKLKPNRFETLNLAYDWTPPTSFFQNDVARIMNNPFYLPTERGLQSIFSLGKNSIQNLSDSLFNQLARIDQIARMFKEETPIEPLQIMYKNVNGRGYIRKVTEDKFYSLFNAASGYKTAIPIVLVTKYYNGIRRKTKTVIIEEPELDLFPAAQEKLIQYLVEHLVNKGSSLLIETHSPYSLTSLNNLMYAYQVGQDKPEETDKIITQKYWLNPADVAVYRLKTDGTCDDIMDKEINQIRVEEIDGISEVLTNDWHKLADVAYGNGK